jgi:hypothetical protein
LQAIQVEKCRKAIKGLLVAEFQIKSLQSRGTNFALGVIRRVEKQVRQRYLSLAYVDVDLIDLND